ncbi:MAG: sigma-70 family RNA polymerase sigma factor [Verrucomicrobiota bacterium]|nr:sigma-70 family RNA polymerase sigma factor [Verrucomicrobiota bacterium]
MKHGGGTPINGVPLAIPGHFSFARWLTHRPSYEETTLSNIGMEKPNEAPEGKLEEFALIEAALAGDEAAASTIRCPENNARLEAILRNRGASDTEARDIIADLWTDCFDSREGRRPLLEKFSGKGTLNAFLTRTALNRLIDYKRRQKFRGELPGSRDEQRPGDAFDALPGEEATGDSEDRLVGLLRDAMLAAFSRIDPEKLVVLKLVKIHGIDQELAGKMWNWSQSKVSRNLSAVMEEIRAATVSELKRIDPWLELRWEDFVGLCKQSSDLFG